MTLTQLRYFLGVVEHGGFARAAARIFVAQSALSTQVRKLEEELGAALLVRNPEGVQLTPAGELLCARARAVFAELAACRKEIHELLNEEIRRVVRVGISMALSRIVTVPLLRRVQTEWPSISLHIREALSSEIEHGLEHGELDLGIGLATSGEQPASDGLRDERVYLVSALEPGGRTGPPIHLRDLHRIPLVVPTRRYAARRFIDQEVARFGPGLTIKMELDSLEQSMELVMAGDARTVMLVAMFLPNWRAGKVTARPVEGLSRLPRLFVRESRLTGGRASAAVKQAVKEVSDELTRTGTWPTSLGEVPSMGISDALGPARDGPAAP
ncbi:MAG: LysR family transcriptional regulator [Lautropia sp.]